MQSNAKATRDIPAIYCLIQVLFCVWDACFVPKDRVVIARIKQSRSRTIYLNEIHRDHDPVCVCVGRLSCPCLQLKERMVQSLMVCKDYVYLSVALIESVKKGEIRLRYVVRARDNMRRFVKLSRTFFLFWIEKILYPKERK